MTLQFNRGQTLFTTILYEIWVHSMVNETSAVPSFYTSEFYEKANEVLLLEYGIRKEDISSEISEEVYLCLIQNIVIDN